jgi:hypothetical protein
MAAILMLQLLIKDDRAYLQPKGEVLAWRIMVKTRVGKLVSIERNPSGTDRA